VTAYKIRTVKPNTVTALIVSNFAKENAELFAFTGLRNILKFIFISLVVAIILLFKK
jgi:hypothetical protein